MKGLLGSREQRKMRGRDIERQRAICPSVMSSNSEEQKLDVNDH